MFDWDRMLATQGNTAAYLQYACARIHSILRKADAARAPIDPAHPAERALALELLAFPAVIETVERTMEFHRLAGHLFAVASAFSDVFEHCRVLGSPARLALCELTLRTLTQGLELLGIAAPERM